MKYVYTSILSLIIFQVAFSQQTLVGELEHNGVTRSYRLYLPSGYEAGMTQLPLVFNLHGYTSNAVQQELYTNMNALAEAESFIVCHPDGINESWNVGFGNSVADDVGFLDALISIFHAVYDVNLRRVYSTGMSNGGYMSYKLACELTDRIAAIASVTGSMVPNQLNQCNPSRPIPVMQIHGTADPTVPYSGFALGSPIEPLVDWWVTHNGCAANATVIDIPDLDTTDNCTAELYEYVDCDGNTKVEFYKITDGGHTWPSGLIDINNLGPTNRDFSANEVIWEFFKQFELPADVVPVKNVLEDHPRLDVFPNPSGDFFNVRLDDGDFENLEIFDITGKSILEIQSGNENIISIDASHWNVGTYFIKVNTAKVVLTEKIMKK